MQSAISFNRLGKIGLVIKQLRSYQNSQVTNLVGANPPPGVPGGLNGQYSSEPSIQAFIGSSYIGLLNSPGSIGSTVASLARDTVNRMVYRDNPRIGQTLESGNVFDSMIEIIRQMKNANGGQASRYTVLPHSPRTAIWTNPEVAADPARFYNPNFSPSGNGVVVTSVIRPFDGLTLQNAFAETIKLECSGDSFIGGATAGNESFNVTGQGSQGDPFAFDWPLGSNCRTSLTTIDGTKNNSSGNKLNNSGFDSFAGDAPNKFIIPAGLGTPGVHIFKEISIVMTGGSALRIRGDGSNLTELRQQFGSSNGTTDTLEPLTQYSFNIFARRDGTTAGAGVATIDLIDSNGIVINDANGVANSFTISLTGLTQTYTPYNLMFRTPLVMPSTYFWRLRLSTALTNLREVYFDLGSLGLATQLYTSGDFLAVHSGSIPFRLGDYTHALIANGRGVAGTLDTFQTLMARLFSSEVYNNELIFPYSTIPNISDTALIA